MTAPVLFVTNHVPPDRAGAFAALHERVDVELALFGGRSHHATGGVADPGVPHRHVGQSEVGALAARGGPYRAVVCGTAGRVALPLAYAGARRGRRPFVLWTALWAPVRTPAHRAAAPLMRHVHAGADAVVTYGPHVSAYARTQGARRLHVAPQAVDGAFWTASPPAPVDRPFTAVWVGRDDPGKGLDVLLDAWTGIDRAHLHLVGDLARATPEGVTAHGTATPTEVRNFLAAADVLVLPSVSTPAFREPWGLVANEAMHQGLPVIATDAVGAAAGGLVRHERNGLVVPEKDPTALRAALVRLRDDATLRGRLAAAARRDVAPFTFAAWADGMATGIEAAMAAHARLGRTAKG